MYKKIKIILLISTSILYPHIHEEGDRIPIGNFALPTAQIPGPLFGFGQNIVDAGDIQGYDFVTYVHGPKKYFFDNELFFLFGITDFSSIVLEIPVPVISKENGSSTSGFGDILLQGEYAYFAKHAPTSLSQATIIGTLFLPSGVLDLKCTGEPGVVPTHDPYTGAGSPSFLIGGTLSHMTIDWYYFLTAGNIFNTERHCTKIGNSTHYQAGIGRNLKHLKEQVLLLLLEFDGIRYHKDKLAGVINPDSGGHIIFLGPSLWYSTRRFIFQVGFQVPVYQKLFGQQNKTSFQVSVSFGYTFQHYES
jgi:hypothetical protein